MIILVLAVPIIVGLLLAMATRNPAWIFAFAIIEWFVYTLYACIANPSKRKPPKNIDEYTNEYGDIKWWHED